MYVKPGRKVITSVGVEILKDRDIMVFEEIDLIIRRRK